MPQQEPPVLNAELRELIVTARIIAIRSEIRMTRELSRARLDHVNRMDWLVRWLQDYISDPILANMINDLLGIMPTPTEVQNAMNNDVQPQ